MKISLASDLHISHRNPIHDFKNEEGSSILILAGDIFDYCGLMKVRDRYQLTERFKGFFRSCSENYPCVVYVPGNHEYYGAELSDATLLMYREALSEFKNISLVNNTVIYIDGLSLICSTLWSNVTAQEEIYVRYSIADYTQIGLDGRTLRIEDTNTIHKNSFKFIEDAVATSDKCVIVTHHAMSRGSIAEEFRESEINSAFYTDYTQFIFENTDVIKACVHGHMHNPFHYFIGKTEMLCNPRGYHGESKRTNPYKPLQFTV